LSFIVFAAMLWSPWAGLGATAMTLLTIAMVAALGQAPAAGAAGVTAMPTRTLDWIAISATALLFGIALVVAFRYLHEESRGSAQTVASTLQELETERGSLQARVDSQNAQLRAVIEVGHAATGILDPAELTARVVSLISERFGYYYAAIFLVNERGDQAELQSATGEAGRLLKERRHQLPVGGRSMVGRAISTRQARIAQDTGAEPVRFDNPLLPYTRSEIALPLIVGERVLGALDVQSTKATAFGPAEIETLQGMADQVAIAVENARLFEASKQNLQEMQSIQRQYVQGAWNPLGQAQKLEYEVGDEELAEDSSALQIPLSLRDEIIGQISLAAESDWTPEQRNLVEAVATQAALALENARLLEASQSAARREHVLAEITGHVWSSTTMDGILRTALTELARSLDATEASIELKMDQRHD
ncbi:MAG: GAF domain-containing protein, partial [Rudaea sp.]